MGPEHLEMVRRWRNDPAVSRYMEARQHITPEMQQRWFDSLDPARQFYFVIEASSRPLGVAQLKNRDAVLRTAESGIYIARPELRGRRFGLEAYQALLRFGFVDLDLLTVGAHILSDNPASIRFHEALGFVRVANQEAVYNQQYTLDRTRWERIGENAFR